MHSEHRHHLQQNDLGQLALKSVPWFERYGMQALIGIVAVIAALVGGTIWWSSATNADADAWSAVSLATTVDEFGDVVDKYPGTLPAAWASLRSGELNLESGVTAMFRDRELGVKDLEAAKKDFDRVLSASVALPDNVRQRALLGLARVLEANSDGDTQPAIEAYERLTKEFPDSIYKSTVDAKVAELKTSSVQDFYRWFHEQQPKPAAFPAPADGRTNPTEEENPFALPPAAASPDATKSEPPATETPGSSTEATKTPESTEASTPATPETKSPETKSPEPSAPAAATPETPPEQG